MRKYIFIQLLLIGFSLNAQNINNGEIEQKNYFEKIPYVSVADMIIIQININGKDYNFQLDTGAPFAISERVLKEFNFPIIDAVRVTDSNGKTENIHRTIVPKLNLGNISFRNVEGIVFNENNFMFECLDVDGIIGSNMLRKSVLQFDFQNKTIYITDDIKNLNLQNSTFGELILDEFQSSPLINILLEDEVNSIKTQMMIDSGFNGFLDFPTNYYEETPKEFNVFNEISKQNGAHSLGFWGIQDKTLMVLVNVPMFNINNFIFKDVVFTTGNSTKPLLGNQLFTYGKTTLDYNKKRFYFEPYENIKTYELSQKPFPFGISFLDDKFIVDLIWDKSLESQINIGDEILSYNGIDFTNLSFCDFLKMNRKIDKNLILVQLKDLITGEIKKIEIKRINMI